MLAKYGVTQYGFRRKLFSEILQEKRSLARETFGDDIDLSNTSFLGLLLENQAEVEATLWENIEDVYLSAFVDYSTGHSLDGVGKYITISRRPAIRSHGFITIVGDNGTIIRKGFRVEYPTADIVFETMEDVTIIENSIEVPIRPIVAGEITNVPAMTITKIINPMMGVGEVYNERPTEGGLDIETDEEFRLRYQLSSSRGGGSTVAAIRAALLDMDEVVDADVKENTTMEIVDGIAPKSVAAYVFGGTDEEVAQTILKAKAGGVEAFGEIYVGVEDLEGQVHQIGFTRPSVVDIYVKVSIKPGEGLKSEKVYKRAVINYIGGTDEDGIQYKGLKLGEGVVLSRIVAAVSCLGGVSDIEVRIGIEEGVYQASNIELTTNQIARVVDVVIDYDL